MDFYTALADYYDEIFPLENLVVEFAEKSISTSSLRATILDIGCATGRLAAALAKKGHQVTGIDLDEKMISMAQENTTNARFQTADMLNIGLLFYETAFSHILCFGNTLVHLPNQEAVESFLSQAFTLLEKNGKLIVQILNYDHILAEHSMILPAIETKSLVFERKYSEREDGRLDFNTNLVIKKTNSVFASSVPLLPLQKDDLDTLVQMAGFSDISYYSGFNREKYRADAFVLVVEARKP
ncbi:MAG: class I SAM-dependent methyltransferase [Spirochaetales bacterium]|nr:class I SAM-dependent methyltransferase [Spirochaetales bacterium]